jgi:sigma-B regulation protein RsbU (phosphoserine phosphatase)
MEAVREMAVGSADPKVFEAAIRDQLIERKGRLEEATRYAEDSFEFADLLGQVDAALARLEGGTYGKCVVCEGQVEAERLLADPLVRVCLGELSDKERQALETDLELAAAIQRGLLPKMALGHGSWATDFVYQPLGPVSGDYCDVIPVGDDLYFILGDVSGKGMAASLLMSSLHAIFRSLIPLGLGLEETMSRANHLLVESSPANQFATMVLGKASHDGSLELVNAGHLPPVLIKNGIAGELNHAGLPLGMFTETHFTSSRVAADRGDTLLMFTDGVTEAVNHEGTEYGTCRLFEAIHGNGWQQPGELIRKCLEHHSVHCGSAQRSDDLTMLALTFN